jgi:hypothetical protein
MSVRLSNALLIAVLLALPAGTASFAATVQDWRQDLDQIAKELKSVHPNAFTITGKLSFQRQLEDLKYALPKLTEEQRVVQAMRIVASIGDGHTYLQPDGTDFGLWYPIRIYQFSDGYFVTSAHKSVADLAGAQILQIAGQPADRVINEARRLLGADNALGAEERLFPVHNALLMKGLGFADSNGALVLRFKARDGNTFERVLPPLKTSDPHVLKSRGSLFDWAFRSEVFGPPIGTREDWIAAYKRLPASAFTVSDPSRPPHLINRSAFVAQPLPKYQTFFIQTRGVNDSFVADFQAALQQIDVLRPRRVIIDLRFNIGGDGSEVEAVIQEFIRRSAKPPWQELYVVTGRKTFSAGVIAAAAFMEHMDVTIVGEPMGAALNHYGDPVSFELPATGLRLKVSTTLHHLEDSKDTALPYDTGPFARVDVPAVFSFDEYANGKDPAVDPILNGQEMRSLRRIAEADGGRLAHETYELRQSSLSRYSWWSPPKPLELEQVTTRLLSSKRTGDAVETAKLNAELNPYAADVWYSLGEAQMAAGEKSEALASWRRVLELDPTNSNKAEILAATGEPAR